jgi:hypothetical protein
MAYPEKFWRNLYELVRFMLDICHHGVILPVGAGCSDISGSMQKIWQSYINVVVN